MSIKTVILGVATVASLALPGVASAQAYGYGQGYYGQGYAQQGYYDQRGYDNRYDNRHGWNERKHWEQRRRWEEKQRRHEWERAHRHGDRDYRDHDRY